MIHMKTSFVFRARIALAFGFLLSLLLGCYPLIKKEVKGPEEAMTRVRFFFPSFEDDMDIQSLRLAITKNLDYLYRLDPGYIFFYGPEKVTCRRVRQTQEAFLDLISQTTDPRQVRTYIKKHFLVMKARGMEGGGSVLFTGYFEPTYEASLERNETFKYPIYRVPDDLVQIDLGLFRERFRGEKIVGRVEGHSVAPYYSRNEIDVERVLDNKNLEIAWLKDPVDVLFLQIQGSGRLLLPDGSTISVGYAASNGHPYRSVGRYMIEKGYIDREEISMQRIREFLRHHPWLVDEILSQNPSYVFFRRLESGPLGNINVPLTPGRSIALDAKLFPKGALAFITCQKPVVDSTGHITHWVPFSRFMLNQDTGGAIKGAGRADIFWGNGPYAELAAGHMKHEGELYFLIKKP
ncbi:MAG: MltA domain-containing protein [Deltaproteobacteria bacterium]|nr:MltA domain-containing protein [Deltaproteobacteria bacterium]